MKCRVAEELDGLVTAAQMSDGEVGVIERFANQGEYEGAVVQAYCNILICLGRHSGTDALLFDQVSQIGNPIMTRLVIELGRYGSLVFGRVLEQDESLRGGGGNLSRTLWVSGTGFAIASSGEPGMDETGLDVCGENTSKDGKEFYHHFNTAAEATRCYEYIREGVRAINAKTEEQAGDAVIKLKRIK